jgi:hypothetical protein
MAMRLARIKTPAAAPILMPAIVLDGRACACWSVIDGEVFAMGGSGGVLERVY